MTTMPPAEVPEVLDEWIEANNVNRRRGHEKVRMDAELEQARTAVAALIEREAALAARVAEFEASGSSANTGPHIFCDENGCAYSLAGKAECGAHCCRLLSGELEARNG